MVTTVKVNMVEFIRWLEAQNIKFVGMASREENWKRVGGSKYGLNMFQQDHTGYTTSIPERFVK